MAATQSGTTAASATSNDQSRQQSQDQQNQSSNQNQMQRRQAYESMTPFGVLQRFLTEDLTHLFGQPDTRLGKRRDGAAALPFAPKIDVMQHANELVIKADLPGVDADNVTVEVNDDSVVISGQRNEEQVEDRDGIYRVERSFGAFFREIPLPQGAIADQAKATFKDGVLEITVPAPPEQVSRGRKLEIAKDKSHEKS